MPSVRSPVRSSVWVFSKNQAIRYESQIKAGKFLVTLKGDEQQLESAKKLLSDNNAETTEVVECSGEAA